MASTGAGGGSSGSSTGGGGASAGGASAGLDPKREFRKQVDVTVGKCVESMAQLIKAAKMGTRREEAYLEANRITVLTSTILQSSEQLLTQAEQLKRIHVLQDMEAINAEVDADTRALEARRDELKREIGKWEAIVQEAAEAQLEEEAARRQEREGGGGTGGSN